MISDASKRVTMFRESLGLRQREFAQELGVSQPSVARMEKSESAPSKGFLKKLYDRYGVSTDWVLTGKGAPLQATRNLVATIDRLVPPEVAAVVETARQLAPSEAQLQRARREEAKRFPNYPDAIEWVKVRPFDIDTSGEKPERVAIYDTKALISLPKEWFEDRKIDPDNAGILRCKDVHMLSVPYDALILVDFGDTGLAFNSIHALVQGGELRVRWLAPVRDAGALVAVVLTAERPAHSETLQGAELAGIVILGRVRAVISTLD